MDLFIIKTFLSKLLGTFFICLFIFIMQLLWMWVDDFVEKGLDMAVLIKFFADGSITAAAAALYFNLVDKNNIEKSVKWLVEKVRNGQHKADFGILGAKYTPAVLSDNGYADDAF